MQDHFDEGKHIHIDDTNLNDNSKPHHTHCFDEITTLCADCDYDNNQHQKQPEQKHALSSTASPTATNDMTDVLKLNQYDDKNNSTSNQTNNNNQVNNQHLSSHPILTKHHDSFSLTPIQEIVPKHHQYYALNPDEKNNNNNNARPN
eukprot:UN07038